MKGFELKGFLRFVARMWLACVGRVDGSFLALRPCGPHLLDDLFHGGVDAVLFEFAFPDGYGRPAHLSECRHGGAVALDVATELCLPKLNVTLGLAGVALGAAVPKAAVDEDGDLAPGEGDLKAKAEDGSIDSVTKNADGTLTVKKGEYSVTVENKTNSSGGSSSGGSTGGETQTCRALGFEGYHEMRIALAQANATGVLVNQQAPSPDADTATLCEHASALFMTAINGTQNALSPEAVDRAVALLRQAKQVYCMGQGGSMVVADEICARFACVTNKFRATGDSHMQIMAASLMTPQDVVLFVSYSGATRDMMETLRVVKETGAKVILITHYEDSPGAKLADIVLLCGAQESPLDSGSIPIKVAVLYVAEVLVLRFLLDDKQRTTEAQERTTEALAVKML